MKNSKRQEKVDILISLFLIIALAVAIGGGIAKGKLAHEKDNIATKIMKTRTR